MITGISHVQLVVRDVAASAAWYADVLGLEPFVSGTTDSGPYAALRHRGSGLVIGMQTAAPQQATDTPGIDHLAFGVADGAALDELCERLRARGYAVGDVFDEAVSRNARLRSPDGVVLEFSAPRPRG